jgi:thioredoxin reductase
MREFPIRPAAVSEPRLVVVIGAGPYGLAVAAHLRERGVAVRTFGETMSSWRTRMPIGMFLKSTASASNIASSRPGNTLVDYCTATGVTPYVGHRPIAVDDFIGYGDWFQSRLVPELEVKQVVRVAPSAGGFDVILDSGEELGARAVVVASGFVQFAYVPSELVTISPDGPSAAGALSHSGQLHDLSSFAGRSVAVIGGGQSALETAALLHETGAEVRVLVRRDRVIFGEQPADLEHQGRGTLLKPESHLGPGWSHFALSQMPGSVRYLRLRQRLWLVANILGPSGAWWLRERVFGRFPVDVGERVVGASVDGGRVVLNVSGPEGGHELSVDHVVAATGYRVSLDRLAFLTPELQAMIATLAGWPRLAPSFGSSVPGLYFTGLAAAATFGPLMRFVAGSQFAARRISAALAR